MVRSGKDFEFEGMVADEETITRSPIKDRGSRSRQKMKALNLHSTYQAKGFDIHSIKSPRESSRSGRDDARVARNSGDEEEIMPDSARTAERIKWKKGQLIGCGSFGRVFLGLNQSTGQLMAVKQLLLPVTYKVIHN
jgi:hypothetical protein